VPSPEPTTVQEFKLMLVHHISLVQNHFHLTSNVQLFL